MRTKVILLTLLSLLSVTNCGLLSKGNKKHNTKSQREQIDMEHYYSVNNDLDGDFILSQLTPLIATRATTLLYFTFPYGGVEVITSDVQDQYFCHADGDICNTSLVHYCIFLNDYVENLPFLQCYFQSELYPTDLMGASKHCFERLTNSVEWEKMTNCAQNTTTLKAFAETLWEAQNFRPMFDKTPHIFLIDEYSNLAPIDLQKALCRIENSDNIWNCESVNQFKKPDVTIYYDVYSQEAKNFFDHHLTVELTDQLSNSISLEDLMPNPNKVLNCGNTTGQQDNADCTSYQSHWCAHMYLDNIGQIAFIQCSFGKSDSISSADKVKQCLTDQMTIEQMDECIKEFNDEFSEILTSMQKELNILIEPNEQKPIEVIIRGRPDVKAATNGLLQELCYNYFDVDNETLACQVVPPKMHIFYQTASDEFAEVFFDQVIPYLGQYAPFETIAQFEFVPYGLTKFIDGKYQCDSEEQCHANWIHACIAKNRFDTLERKYQFFLFLACTTDYDSSANPLNVAEACVNLVYEDGPNFWSQNLLDCARTDEQLKEQLRSKTEAIKLSQIPEYAIDGKKVTSDVGDNLLRYICGQFNPIQPRACFDIDTDTNQTLRLTVYLTASQESQLFVRNQLKPLITAEPRDASLRLRDVIEWQFVPFGSATVNDSTGELNCENGPNECLANRILACAGTSIRQNGRLGKREDRLRMANFVVCFLEPENSLLQSSPLEAANLCVQHLSPLDSYTQLWQCALQQGKEKILLQMQQLTLNNYPHLSNFPTVAIDNKVQSTDVSNIELKSLLCTAYKANPSPAECLKAGAYIAKAGSTLMWLMLTIAVILAVQRI